MTPLALDTLRARRVTWCVKASMSTPRRSRRRDEIRKVAIAGDHTGVALKAALRDHLRSRGIAVHDLGTDSSEPVDYPDTARPRGACRSREERRTRGS